MVGADPFGRENELYAFFNSQALAFGYGDMSCDVDTFSTGPYTFYIALGFHVIFSCTFAGIIITARIVSTLFSGIVVIVAARYGSGAECGQ